MHTEIYLWYVKQLTIFLRMRFTKHKDYTFDKVIFNVAFFLLLVFSILEIGLFYNWNPFVGKVYAYCPETNDIPYCDVTINGQTMRLNRGEYYNKPNFFFFYDREIMFLILIIAFVVNDRIHNKGVIKKWLKSLE